MAANLHQKPGTVGDSICQLAFQFGQERQKALGWQRLDHDHPQVAILVRRTRAHSKLLQDTLQDFHTDPIMLDLETRETVP
jgi:hypothetical protein